MAFMDRLRDKVRANPGKLVFPEGKEPRVVQAARILLDEGLASAITLLGSEQEIAAAAAVQKTDLSGLTCIDPSTNGKRDDFVNEYHELRRHKGVDKDHAARAMLDVLNYGAMLVRKDEVDGMVAGSINATADVLRAAITIVRPAKGMKIVSSCFAMIVPNCSYGADGSFIYADCGVMPDPNPEQLASIAVAAADSCRRLLGTEPVVAMLSFSTKGSAEHALVDKVREATALAQKAAPGLKLDGELQADAALVPSVGERKASASQVAGKANTLVFPDLNAGNIAYKLTERLTGGEAYGPIIQGLTKPVNDLSRGCKAGDIVNVGVITQIQNMAGND